MPTGRRPTDTVYEDGYHRDVAIPALARHLDYEELFEDSDERYHSAFDSVGLLGGLPCFVEVKVRIGTSEIAHVDSKIHQGLRVYADGNDGSVFAEAMRGVCPAGRMPIVGVVATGYGRGSDGRLAELLARRSSELGFCWQVWLCDVSGEVSVLASDMSRIGETRTEVMPEKRIAAPRRKRNVPKTEAEHGHDAGLNGAGDIFDEAMAKFRSVGATFKSQNAFVSGACGPVHFRIYGSHSDADRGLLAGIQKEHRETLEEAGFVVEGIGHFGHPDFRIADADALSRFVDLVAKASG